MQYQSFPGVKGGSASSQKLAALRLPPLADKRFLDVGCNEGFFCGYALFEGASRVVGIDYSAEDIEKAKVRFPEAEFINQSWDILPQGPFDVIILLSALHYAEDQEALIHKLMSLLADDGLLVLEIGMAPNQKSDWVKVKRSIDECWFPTRSKMSRILKDYAWKVIGHSVTQTGDPLPRYVVHVRKFRPYAWLLLQEPGSGKSTISRRMFAGNPNIKIISGDRIYYQINQGDFEISDKLRTLVTKDYSSTTIDRTTKRVFEHGLAHELAQLWSSQAGFNDFALDSYVPLEFRQSIKDALQELGYFPAEVSWNHHAPLKSAKSASITAKKYADHLEKEQLLLNCERIWVDKILKKTFMPFIKWHLDSPVDGEVTTGSETARISGWAITKDYLQSDYQLYVLIPQEHESIFSPTKERIDVLNSVFGNIEATPDFWKKNPCGFHFHLPISSLKKGVEFGLVINNTHIPLAQIILAPSKKNNFAEKFIHNLKKIRG